MGYQWIPPLDELSCIRALSQQPIRVHISLTGIFSTYKRISMVNLVAFSEQQLVDCDGCVNGCYGNAFRYLDVNWLLLMVTGGYHLLMSSVSLELYHGYT